MKDSLGIKDNVDYSARASNKYYRYYTACAQIANIELRTQRTPRVVRYFIRRVSTGSLDLHSQFPTLRLHNLSSKFRLEVLMIMSGDPLEALRCASTFSHLPVRPEPPNAPLPTRPQDRTSQQRSTMNTPIWQHDRDVGPHGVMHMSRNGYSGVPLRDCTCYRSGCTHFREAVSAFTRQHSAT